jgi:flagellar biosynthesis/type III secretory pathway protein FliH
LARAALEKLFTDPAQWAAMVEAMLARQLAALRRSSIVAIHVSPHDFVEVEVLASALGSEASRFVRDPELASGACRIACRLGQVDLDVREQWSALAAVLDAMGDAG